MNQLASTALVLSFVIVGVARAEQSCPRDISPATNWVEKRASESAYIFYGTVESVSPPPPESGESHDILYVRVVERYKGNCLGGEVKLPTLGSGTIPGESRVFFLDHSGRIVSCSDYDQYLTDFGVISELRRVLGSGT